MPPSLKKATQLAIAVEGATVPLVLPLILFPRLAPGLSAIDALKTSRQIFHKVARLRGVPLLLSLHLEIFLGLWIAILNKSLNIDFAVFIAIFADVATLAITLRLLLTTLLSQVEHSKIV